MSTKYFYFYCKCENIFHPSTWPRPPAPQSPSEADSWFPLLSWWRSFDFLLLLFLCCCLIGVAAVSDSGKPGRWPTSSPVNAPALPRRQAEDARGGGRRHTHVTFLTVFTPLAASLPASIHSGQPLTSFRLN